MNPVLNSSSKWLYTGVPGGSLGPHVAEVRTHFAVPRTARCVHTGGSPVVPAGDRPFIPCPYVVWSGTPWVALLTSNSLRKVVRVGPGAPLLVVIRMTPCPARAPYMAAADAPFRISIEAMSLGLTSAPRFWETVPVTFEVMPFRFSPVTVVELSMGTPSTTISGCPLPLMVLAPRMRMNDEAPGSPACDTTST